MKKKSEIEERMVQKRGKQGRRDTLRSRRVFAKAAGEQRPMLRHQARSARTGGNDLKKGTRDASRQRREPPGLPSESLKDPAFKDPHVQLCLQTTMEKKKKLLPLVIRSLISSTMTSLAAVSNSYFPSLLPEGLNSDGGLPGSPKRSPSLPFFPGYKNRLKRQGRGPGWEHHNKFQQRKTKITPMWDSIL